MKRALVALVMVPLFVASVLSAQALIVAQAPDGAGWRFTLVLTNTTTSDAVVAISFLQDIDSAGDTAAWTPPFQESVNLTAITVPAASSVFLHSTGTAANLTQGWAQINGGPGVEAYVVYTYTNGESSSEGTAPGVTGAPRILVPFDNTGSLSTSLAVVFLNDAPGTVEVNIKTSNNNNVITSSLTLPANAQVAFGMPTQFPGTAVQRGLAEFYTTSGSLAIIALQANTNAATGVFSFTTAPVYSETGAPIISASGTGGSGGGFATNSATVASVDRTKPVTDRRRI